MSTTTVSRLKDGCKSCVVSEKTTIFSVNQTRFSRQNWHWIVDNHWSSIIVSDETKTELGYNNTIFVWRKWDEKPCPECLGLGSERDTEGGASFVLAMYILLCVFI